MIEILRKLKKFTRLAGEQKKPLEEGREDLAMLKPEQVNDIQLLELSLAFLVRWGVPEEKAKKFLLRHAMDLTIDEVDYLFAADPAPDSTVAAS